MSLVTRCPTCATTFKVLPAQLSARNGRVRCGKCAAVFDGVVNLLTEEAIAALPAEPSPQMGLFDPREKAGEPRETGEVLARRETAVPPADSPGSHVDAAESGAAVPAMADAAEPEEESETTADASVPGEADEPAPPTPAFLANSRPRSSFMLVWALLALMALAALAGQATLNYRSEISVLFPVTRAYLEAACDTLGCEVRLPRRADLMSIESSDLQADTRRKDVIILNALLRNRAPFAQEYPDLELTLTDQGDRAVIRRVLKPREYLLQKSALRMQGIAGGAEEVVRVHLETSNMPATGYQLFLFYPCPPPSTSLFWQLSYPSRCQDSRNK